MISTTTVAMGEWRMLDDGHTAVLGPREGIEPSVIEQALARHGVVLLRGFAIDGEGAFRDLACKLGGSLLSYDFASTPRSALGDGVYSSTEYPAHQSIPLHNEQSYGRRWPLRIFFGCLQAAQLGGETPLADSGRVYQLLDPATRARLDARGVMYVRNYGGGLDLPWQKVFNTSDRAQVEALCRAQEIHCEWKDEGELRTRQRCQAVARHPRSQQLVWFNQAHLFHVSALAPETREALLDAVELGDLPRNAYYGDGAPLEDALLEEIRAAYARASWTFPWQTGDLLVVDNMQVAHGRRPFAGPRKVAVAMCRPHGNLGERITQLAD